MRTYRFYNGQRVRGVFLQFSNNPCRLISTGFDTRVSLIAGERGRREIGGEEGKREEGDVRARVIFVPRSLNPWSELYDCVSRVRVSPPVSCGNSQVLSSRSRRCIDPWHPPSSLFLPFRSSFADPLSCSFLSLSFPFSLFRLPRSSYISTPSLFFLLVASRSRRPHAERDVTRPTRGRNSNICSLLHFKIVFDLYPSQVWTVGKTWPAQRFKVTFSFGRSIE